MTENRSARRPNRRPVAAPRAGTYRNAPSQSISVGGTRFIYRELGIGSGAPVVFLNHLGANLDDWDPRVVDGIAGMRRVIAFDNRGVGASEGKTPISVEAMATDAVSFIRALGLDQVDLLGFSLGGFISQVIAETEPGLVRKIIIAGSGPAGGEGIANVTKLTYLDALRALATLRDPKELLFFTRTPHGKSEAKAFLNRLKERTVDRDRAVSVRTFRSQLRAIHAWGCATPVDLSRIPHPVLVANGEDDRMVPTSNSYDLTNRLPNASLRIYSDAGHGGIFQAHKRFVPEALEFLAS